MAGTRAKALAKMQAAYGYLEPCCHAAVCRQRSGQLMVQTSIYSAVMYGTEVWVGGQDKMSAVVKALHQHSSPASPRLLF
jgi:hypothetical protein